MSEPSMNSSRLPFASLLIMLGSVTVSACAAGPSATTAAPAAARQDAANGASAPAARPTEPKASYHFLRGYLAELSQDTDTAIREYQASLRVDGASDFLKTRLAGLYFSMGDTANALSYADQVRPASVGDGLTLSHLAGIYAGVGQRERAIEIYDHSIALDPSRGEPYFSKGWSSPISKVRRSRGVVSGGA